jgi:hypothetical protein
MSEPASVSDRALGWTVAHLDFFNPLQNTPKPDELRHKAFVELALTCLHLSRQPAAAQNERLQRLLEFIARIGNLPFFRDAIFRVSNMFVPHVLLAVVLRACGLADDRARWLALGELIDRATIQVSERPVFRTMELRYLLDLGQIPHRLPSYTSLVRRGILSRPLNVAYVTDADAYAVTHTLFYLSDFGSKPISEISSSRREDVRWSVEHLLGMYAHSGNWDLVGELLLSCTCLGVGREASALYSVCWRVLSDAQWPNGGVPGPQYDPARAQNLEGVEQQSYVFEQCYHTTLVAVLAGAICGAVEENESR